MTSSGADAHHVGKSRFIGGAEYNNPAFLSGTDKIEYPLGMGMQQREMTKIVVFDTETTDLVPKKTALNWETLGRFPHIVQLSALLYDTETRKVESMLNEYVELPPGVVMAEGAKKANHITEEMLAEKGRPLRDVLVKFAEMVMECRVIVAHNMAFDHGVVQAEVMRLWGSLPAFVCKWLMLEDPALGITKICTMVGNTPKGRGFKWPRLVNLYMSTFGYNADRDVHKDLHNSAADTALCVRIYLKTKFNQEIRDAEFFRMLEKFKETEGAGLRVGVASRTRSQTMKNIVI